MDRRAYVAAAASVFAPAASGCAGFLRNEETTHEWNTVYYTEAGAVVEGGLDLGNGPDSARYLFAFGTESRAREAIDFDVLRELGDGGAVSFVNDVDFGNGVLLVHQEYPVDDAPERKVMESSYDDQDEEVQVHIAAKGLLRSGSTAAETMLIAVGFREDVSPERAIVADADGETISATVE